MALGSLINSVFGSKATQKFKPVDINAGGLVSTGAGTITPTAERLGVVKNISDAFGQQGGFLETLRQKVAPGFSDLRSSRLSEVENARMSAIGNLRENLQRRRVLGSSFGQDSVIRGEKEFAQQKDRIQAESFLQEIDMSQKLIQDEFQAKRGQFQTFLDELNLEAQVGTQLATGATAQLGANARLQAQLDVIQATGFGSFVSKAFGIGAKAA